MADDRGVGTGFAGWRLTVRWKGRNGQYDLLVLAAVHGGEAHLRRRARGTGRHPDGHADQKCTKDVPASGPFHSASLLPCDHSVHFSRFRTFVLNLSTFIALARDLARFVFLHLRRSSAVRAENL